jgi:hypothetical protein
MGTGYHSGMRVTDVCPEVFLPHNLPAIIAVPAYPRPLWTLGVGVLRRHYAVLDLPSASARRADNDPVRRHDTRDKRRPKTTEQLTMPTDCHKSGLAAMSRTMPEKTAHRMPREIFSPGYCSRLSSSGLIAIALAQTWRIPRIRLPVRAPSGAIRRRAARVTLGQARLNASIRTVK